MTNITDSISYSDEEISNIEHLFFGGNSTFNEEQKRVIRCFSSENIQACPGSGKTTTLAAKLLLLRNRLQATRNLAGVCILTHTNVAVETIKEKLGSDAASFYSNYPNFLGTIQAFVNKYLSIPFYRYQFNKSVESIDDDVFFSIISKRERQAASALAYLSRSGLADHLGEPSFNIFDFSISKSASTLAPIVGVGTRSYQQLAKLKHKVLKDGYLKYEEAFSLAFEYIRKLPAVAELFSLRFPIVFLDEMQDTADFQCRLIVDLFQRSDLLQTIGDGNQDIYGHYELNCKTWPRSNQISINTSSRFAQPIADIVSRVSVETVTLLGTAPYPEINPHILVFDDSTIDNVKSKYVELICQYNLDTGTKPVFKAVGARKADGRLSIRSYFADFDKNTRKVREHYDSFDDYLNIIKSRVKEERNVRVVKEHFGSLFQRMLKCCEVRHPETNRYFSATSLERHFKSANPLLLRDWRHAIESWIRSIIKGHDIKEIVIEYFKKEILGYFKMPLLTDLQLFIDSPGEIESTPDGGGGNIYQKLSGDTTISIVFDTIHAVKGETHTATLYLETYNKAYDLEKLLPLLSKTQNKTKTYISSNCKRMRQAFVAMSRPTSLLCLAVHKDRINLNAGWAEAGFVILDC